MEKAMLKVEKQIGEKELAGVIGYKFELFVPEYKVSAIGDRRWASVAFWRLPEYKRQEKIRKAKEQSKPEIVKEFCIFPTIESQWAKKYLEKNHSDNQILLIACEILAQRIFVRELNISRALYVIQDYAQNLELGFVNRPPWFHLEKTLSGLSSGFFTCPMDTCSNRFKKEDVHGNFCSFCGRELEFFFPPVVFMDVYSCLSQECSEKKHRFPKSFQYCCRCSISLGYNRFEKPYLELQKAFIFERE